MCGKFTALASWSELVAFSQPLVMSSSDDGQGSGEATGEGSNDAVVTYRVGGPLPVILWDAEARVRRVVRMRWGFPDPRDWRRPRPIHARSETIDAKEPFRTPFHAGQRGIVVFRTFNEGEEVGKKTVQWTVTPRDGKPLAIAVIYEEWVNAGQRLFTFVQVTTPPNKLIATITDRMPAIIRPEHQSLWLGETAAPLAEVKAILEPYDDAGGWDFGPEPKKPKPKPKA